MPDPNLRHWPLRAVVAVISIALIVAIAGRIAGPSPVEETGSVVASRFISSDPAGGSAHCPSSG